MSLYEFDSDVSNEHVSMICVYHVNGEASATKKTIDSDILSILCSVRFIRFFISLSSTFVNNNYSRDTFFNFLYN